MSWFKAARLVVFNSPDPQLGSTFLDFDKLISDKYYFAASIRTQMTETLYQLMDVDDPPSISVEVNLGYAGNKSLNLVEVMSDKTSDSVLARNVIQCVLLDRATRKPASIPDWWKCKYEPFVVENRKLVLSIFPTPKENTKRYSIKPSWNDVDSNMHVGHLSYVGFCFDAAMDAVRNNFYAGFYGDILKYNVRTFESTYKGESQAGDLLTVVTWQNSQNPLLLHFSIEKDAKVIYQSSAEFFGQL